MTNKTSMNRRRFVSALALLGVAPVARLRANEEGVVPENWYYACKSRLLRGTLPNVTGTLRATGHPSRTSIEGELEIAPVALREPKAAIGRFANSAELQQAGTYRYTAARVKLYKDTTSPVDPTHWGDGTSGYIYAGSMEVQFTPYLVDAAIAYPFFIALRVGGDEVLRQQATNLVIKSFAEPFRDITAALQPAEGSAVTMHSIMNRIEKAKGFEVELQDANGRKLATLPFRAPDIGDGRRWMLAEIEKQKAEMVADRAPRVTKSTSSDAGGGGCYLTTAAVGAVGLADDCWELTALRAFRDESLLVDAVGRELVATYYAEAPGVVAGVNRRADAQRVWLRTYWMGVLPCAALARLGWTWLALRRYRGMALGLRRLAGVE